MAYIYSLDKDGIIYSATEPLALAARNASAGAAVENSNSSNTVGIDYTRVGRGATYQYRRAFYLFDVSGASGTAESCDFEVYSSSSNGIHIVPVYSNAHEDLVVDDYNNVFSVGTFDMTDYATSSAWGSSGYHTYDLNSDGLTALNSAIGSGHFKIALVSRDDYLAVAFPSSDSLETIVFSDSAVNKPRIEITYASTAVTYNAPFLGANF